MDYESWAQGYVTGTRLHGNLRTPQLFSVPIASLSATGVAADLEWFADLNGVAAITRLTAEYVGDVSASYSRDGITNSTPVPLPDLLAVHPSAFADAPRLWFRFHLNDESADLTSFTVWGAFARDIPWEAV